VAIRSRSLRGWKGTCGARFATLFNPTRPDGVLSIDISRLDIVEKQLPPGD